MFCLFVGLFFSCAIHRLTVVFVLLDGPIIIIKVQLKIFEGENETLKCDTVHDKHDWSRGDGERVTNERRVLIAENSKLQITGATILDSGEYVCQHSGRKRYIFTVEIEVIVKVEAVLKVFTYKYTPELQNKSSKIYKQTERNFTATMDKVYNNTPGYNRTEVLGFTNGSVNVDFRIIIVFIATDPKNVSKVTDTKAEAGHKVIVEVQDGLLNDLRVSPDVEVKVPPLEPRSITIFDVEHNELSIKWRPPEDSKNFKVSEYVVQHRKFGVKPPIYKNSTFPASEEKKEYSYRIQNLVPETTYMIQVGARNKFGTNYNDEQPKETLSAPFAKWLIAVIVLAGILVVATIVGVIICLRRKAAERRRNAPEEDEDTRFGSMRLASLSQYEDRYVKGVRYAYTNDFFKTSDVHWKEIPYENITLLNELGSGAFGVVYKGEIIREKGDVTPCAVKSLKASATKEEVRDLYNELEIMTNVGYHPNLVNLLGACTEDGHLLVVLELAENGSLLEFLKKSREVNQNYENINSGGITEELKLSIAIDVARGMSHLASFKCIHRDLAARNVLLGENYVAKVADYGMARDVYEQLMYRKETQGKLPVKWMAIESLETYVFTMESDVWSYGVLLWEIESGGLKPYAGMSTTELIAQLKKGYRLEIPVGCSDAMYQVMRDCWDPNPKARPTFDKLVVRLENMAVAL